MLLLKMLLETPLTLSCTFFCTGGYMRGMAPAAVLTAAVLTAGLVCAAAIASAQEIQTFTVARAASAPVIDGRLDDTAWRSAVVQHMVEHDKGGPAPLETTVRLLWDDDYLYIGFYGADSDAWTTFTEDDTNLWEQEVFESFLAPQSAGWTYYEINVSPRNNLVDLFVTHAGPLRQRTIVSMREWDCDGIRHAVYVDGDPAPGTADKSWSAELAIPFARLWTAPKLRPEPGEEWRGNFFRIDRNPDKPSELWEACMNFTGGLGFHVPERFGLLVFMK